MSDSDPSTPEEIAAKIGELRDAIQAAKAEKKPKEEWQGFLDGMLAMKAKYKDVTGTDFDPPKPEAKKKEQQGPSDKNKEKNAAKAAAKAQREAEKAAARAQREQREKEKADRLAGIGQENFGNLPLVQSQIITDKTWTKVEHLTPTLAGHDVLVRGYLQTTRVVGKGVFVVVRSSLYTVQGVAFEAGDGTVSKAMIKFIDGRSLWSM